MKQREDKGNIIKKIHNWRDKSLLTSLCFLLLLLFFFWLIILDCLFIYSFSRQKLHEVEKQIRVYEARVEDTRKSIQEEREEATSQLNEEIEEVLHLKNRQETESDFFSFFF